MCSALVEKQPTEAMLVDVTTPTTSSRDWRTPFIRYMSDGSGFQDKTKNERLIRRSKNYILVDGKLMQKNASSEVLLKCISQDDGIKLLDDIHAGSCGNHAASQRWSGRLSEQIFTGQPRSPTQKNWSDIVRDVSSSPKGPTYLLMRFKLFRRPGLSPAGGST